jgi:hypothetical protein
MLIANPECEYNWAKLYIAVFGASNIQNANDKELYIKMSEDNRVCKLFMTRSIYWTNEATRSHLDEEQRERFEILSKRALQVGIQTKKTSFKRKIIKEVRSII